MNLSDILADLAIERQLDLNRYVGSLQNDLSKLLRDLALDIESQLTGNISEYKEDRLKRALSEIRLVVNDTFGVYSADLQRDLAQLALDEADWVIQSTNGAVATELVSVLPKAALLERLASNVVIDNVAMPDWFKRLEGDTLFRLNQAIGSGIALGETNQVIMKRLFDFRSPNEAGTVIAKTRRNLESIVRTAVQDVTQSARLATYEANADIVKAYEHNSTFDSRTSDVCIARAGLQWDAQTKEGIGHDAPFKRPPLHFACRSILLPVTKSFRELGLDVDDFEPTTRAMIDGQGPTNQTFSEFLTRKGEEFQNRTLGPGKAQLWRDGKISLTDLVNQQGNPLTLAQLREKYDSTTFRQSSGVFGPYDRNVEKVKPDTSTKLRAQAVEFEDAIRNNDNESIALFSRSGNLITTKTGLPDRVPLDNDLLRKARGGLLTHNHPGDSSFSQQDVAAAILFNIREIRAVSPSFRHILVLDGIKPMTPLQIRDEVDALIPKATKIAEKMVASGELPRRFVNTEITHQIWKLFAEKNGLSYKRENS